MPYVTKQYQAVLQCVQSRGADAFTAAELTEDLRHTGHPVGLATVYRQLEKLEASSFFVNIVGRSPQRRVRCTSAAPTLSRTTAASCCDVKPAAVLRI